MPGITVRELVTTLGFDVREQDLNQAESRVNNFKRTISRIGIAAAAGVATIGAAAIKAASDMEDLTIQFETMLGSADAAAQIMGDLQQFAATTPFQLQDLARGSQNLLAFGVEAEDVLGTMRMIGDTAGGNAEKLQGLVLAYGKVQTIGRASMEEIRQMAERGVPIIETLSSNLGVTNERLFEMVSAGEISSETITEAFQTMTSEGGIFFRGMERASQTFSGLLSTLKDNLTLAAAAVGSEILPVVKDLTTVLIGLVQGPIGDLLSVVVGGLRPVISILGDLLMNVLQILGPVSRILEQVFAVISVILAEISTATLESIVPPLLDMAEILAELMDLLLPIVAVFARFFALRIRAQIMRMLAPFRLMFALIKGLLAGLQPLFDLFRSVFGPPIQRLLEMFGIQLGGAAGIIDQLAALAERFGERMGETIANILLWIFDLEARWRGFATFIQGIFNGIVNAAGAVGDWLRILFTNPVEAIKLAWEGILNVFRRVWDWVIERVSTLADWISKIPGIDIRIPKLGTGPEGSGTPTGDTQSTVNNANRTANVAMRNDITISVPPGAAGGGTGLTAETAKRAVETAAQAVFAVELRKLLVDAEF